MRTGAEYRAALRDGRRACDDYDRLTNAVTAQLGMPMRGISLSAIRDAPMVPRRLVTPTR